MGNSKRAAAHSAEKMLSKLGRRHKHATNGPRPKLGWRWSWQKAGSDLHTRRRYRPGALKQGMGR